MMRKCNHIFREYADITIDLESAVGQLDLALSLEEAPEAEQLERSAAFQRHIKHLHQGDANESISNLSGYTAQPLTESIDFKDGKTEPGRKGGAQTTGEIVDTEVEDLLAAPPWDTSSTLGKRKRVSASLEATAKSLVVFNTHIAKVKAAILARPGRPVLPESEWNSLLTGQALDLDMIYSNQFGSRTVATAIDWHAAWDVAREATLIAFPHRTDELAEHTRTITRLFAGSDQSPQSQRAIIAFDRGLRIVVA